MGEGLKHFDALEVLNFHLEGNRASAEQLAFVERFVLPYAKKYSQRPVVFIDVRLPRDMDTTYADLVSQLGVLLENNDYLGTGRSLMYKFGEAPLLPYLTLGFDGQRVFDISWPVLPPEYDARERLEAVAGHVIGVVRRANTAWRRRVIPMTVIEQLSSRSLVDGAALGPSYAGHTLTRGEVAVIALQRFMRLAVHEGIAKKHERPEQAGVGMPTITMEDGTTSAYDMRGVTRAVLEGKLTPEVRVLQLIEEGFGRAPDDSPQMIARRKYLADLGDNDPSPVLLEPVHSAYRSELWSSTFGRLSDLDSIRTIVNGVPASVTGDDLVLRLAMRLLGSAFLAKHGLSYDANTRFADAISAIRRDRPTVEVAFRAELERFSHFTPGSFFNVGSARADTQFNLRSDYAILSKGFLTVPRR